jgi:predicted negative regulator of RcsB-dependent stress response
MSSHLSRKELKQDAVAAEITHGVEYVAAHKTQAARIGTVVVVLLALGGGYWYYSGRQAAARTEALREARRVMDATIGTESKPPAKNFATEDEKQKAVVAALTKVADGYPGTTEGAMAQNYLAGARLEAGDLDAAAALYRQVADKGPAELASTAKLALAQILWGQEKQAEAKALLQQLIDHPTSFVSADHAKLTLARIEMASNPEDARKVLESMKDSTGAARATQLELLGRLGEKAN